MKYAMLTVMVCAAVWGQTTQPTTAPGSQPSKMQVEREKFLQKLKNEGIFDSVRVSNHVGKAVVLPRFHEIIFKLKEKFASVAYAWAVEADPECKILVLLDSQSGKQIGKYGPVYGGLKMD